MATLNPPFESDKGPFGLFIRSVIKKDPSKQPSIKEILEKSKQFSK